MTGPQHYDEAERLLRRAANDPDDDVARDRLARAQVHATLALAAATALPTVSYMVEEEDLGRDWQHTAVRPGVVDVPVPGGEL